jgi:hypothetical protein
MQASLSSSGGSRGRHPFRAQRYKTYGAGREERIVKGLGWFSIGMGLAQLLAPRAMAKASGMPENRIGLMRAVGVRELATGVGLLSRRQPTMWLWTRVAGDAMDLTILGFNAGHAAARKDRVGAAGLAVAGVAVLDVMSSMGQTRKNGMLADLMDRAGAITDAAARTVRAARSRVARRQT